MAMSLKPYAVACICIVALFLLLITMFRDSVGSDRLLRSYTDPRTQELERVTRTLIQQRNNISRQLNLKQQKVGQMQCEVGGVQTEPKYQDPKTLHKTTSSSQYFTSSFCSFSLLFNKTTHTHSCIF